MSSEKIKISDEQRIIFEHIKEGKNVIVDSIAGSGKSTTIINIAQLMPEKLFLHVTYNSMLRKEFKQKVISLNLTNIEVHTYHSLAVKYFHPTAFTDTGIREILALNILPVCEIPLFDIVVLDECQDMTRLYYNFIRLVVSLISNERSRCNTEKYGGWFEGHDGEGVSYSEERPNPTFRVGVVYPNVGSKMGFTGGEAPNEGAPMNIDGVENNTSHTLSPPQLLFLGDYKQCLYEFKGADWRYLTLADKIWNSPPHYTPDSFVHCSLKTSYRITNQMSSFVNNVMLGEYRMNACREGAPVIYIRNTRFNIERIIIHHIKRILDEGDLPSDIFILAPSVKGPFSNVRRLENVLVESGIPCHVPMFENERISDEKVINGKVVFSTFHSVKGRQRKYVFVMNFDNSYFAFNARNLKSTVCPNTLYVATTRATHQLYLLEINNHPTDRPLEFLRMSHSQMSQTDYIDFKGRPQSVFYEEVKAPREEDKIPVHRVTPTDIIKFLPESVIEKITPVLKRIIKPVLYQSHPGACYEIDVPSIVYLKNGLYEDVTDLNGVAIPAIYCDYIQRKNNNIEKSGGVAEGHDVEFLLYYGERPKGARSDIEKSGGVDEGPNGEVTGGEAPNGGARRNIDDSEVENEIPNILWRFIKHSVEQFREGEHLYLKRIFQSLSPSCKTPAQYLYMSNVYIAFQEKLYFKLKQIDEDEYNWLTYEMMEQCNQRIDRIVCDSRKRGHDSDIYTEQPESDVEKSGGVVKDHDMGFLLYSGQQPKEADENIKELEEITYPSTVTPQNTFVFENTFIHHLQDDKHAVIDKLLRPHLNKVELYRFTARLDLITDRDVWELKFVSELTIEHYLQFIIYAWLWKCVYYDDPVQSGKEFKIFNIRKEEVFTLKASLSELTEIVALIIKSKYDSCTTQTEEEFLFSLK